MMQCVEGDGLGPVLALDADGVRPGEGAGAGDDRHLAGLGEAGEAAGQLADDALLPAAQVVDVDLRLGERDAEVAHLLGLGDDLGGVEQRLRRDAADVEADAAERRVASRSARPSCRGRRRGRRRCSRRGRSRGRRPRRGGRRRRLARGLGGAGAAGARRRGRRGRGGAFGLEGQDDGAFGDLVALLDLTATTLPACGRGHLHRRLVGLELDERGVLGDGVAGLHQDGDDGHVLEVPDVGDLDLDLGHASPSVRAAGCAGRGAACASFWRKRAARAPSMARWS